MHDVDSDGKPTRVKGLEINGELREFDVVLAACDVPGIKKLLPESFRKYPIFDNIYELDCVPIATVQVRGWEFGWEGEWADGWIGELVGKWA